MPIRNKIAREHFSGLLSIGSSSKKRYFTTETQISICVHFQRSVSSAGTTYLLQYIRCTRIDSSAQLTILTRIPDVPPCEKRY